VSTVAGRIDIERALRAIEPRLRGLALRCLGRPDDVDDVIQEVSARALASVGRFRGDAALTTWVYRIATAVIADWLRNPWRRRRGPLVDGPARGPGPLEAAQTAEMRARVRRAIALLPPGQRIVLFLREYEGLRYAEIADVLGVPIGTVESRLHTARRRVAKELGR